jgi:CRP-like cAMP-binding protein
MPARSLPTQPCDGDVDTGCRRETVTRLLARLEVDGTIRREGRWNVVT